MLIQYRFSYAVQAPDNRARYDDRSFCVLATGPRHARHIVALLEKQIGGGPRTRVFLRWDGQPLPGVTRHALAATTCERCGGDKPAAESCGCFDNGCQ